MNHVKCFVCYARTDSVFVKKIVNELLSNCVDIWFDQINITPGKSWDDEIEVAIQNAQVILFLASPIAVKSQNVKDELSYARNINKLILPVIITPCVLPLRYQRNQQIDLSGNYENGINHLVSLLIDEKKLGVSYPFGEPHHCYEVTVL